ncbi:hypothetical protein G9C98_008219 [Cotesia typhae]|uniref:Ribose-phosphate pyrophosphokinase N-terminal domain-containing protein n=1 Tax=Cotesia typhae TaxID=2053667 RepID=A0A8J5REC0_9HYME|nr:hypothetical protein G9C98_008219 [Cotesia typhae]
MEKSAASDIVIVSGNSHPELAELIANRLGVKNGGCFVYYKTNRETMVEIADSVRGKDIYIIQTGTKDVNNNIMELLIMAYACKTSSAKNIIGVIPYLPYSKQCKMRKRGCIVSKLLAKMMCKSGLTHIITMDLHQKEIQGFLIVLLITCVPVHSSCSIFKKVPDYRNSVIVAKNPGSAKKATSYAERLRVGIAVIHGEQRESESDMNDGRNSPPTVLLSSRTMEVGVGVPSHPAKKKSHRLMLLDDMVDDVQSFVAAAEVLKEQGANKIYVLATHGLLSSDAPRLIGESPIDEVVVTNTIPHEIQKSQCSKIKTVDISILIAEAIRRIHNKESMSYLFKNVTTED